MSAQQQKSNASSKKTSVANGASGGGRRSIGVIKKNEKGTVYFKLNKKVEILFDGQKVDLGENGILFFTDKKKALEDLEVRKEKGYLSERAEEVSREILSNDDVKYVVEAKLA